MLRAQTAASALAAGLSVLSNFVAVALNPRDSRGAGELADAESATAVEEPEAEAETPVARKHVAEKAPSAPSEWAEGPSAAAMDVAVRDEIPLVDSAAVAEAEARAVSQAASDAAALTQTPVFDIASLAPEVQDLHRRANRVAKVAMQDIKLLRPKDVRLGRENKDICNRLRADLDKARKEYDRRFRTILDHPVDYFHHWMVEILAEGNSEALGDYPYPSPVLRH